MLRILPLFLLLILSGCASQKKITYLQDLPPEYEQILPEKNEIYIHKDDLLSILVNSKDAELAEMFNLPIVNYQVNSGASLTNTSQNRLLGYLVDKDGFIDFPILGKLKVEGMTRSELISFIKEQLIQKGLIKDPIITVQFLNFKVSVLGEVTRPGTFNVSGERFTLLEALSSAGDLTIYGRRDNVKIIRELADRRVVATIDLRKGDIFTSEFYYLQQNDIVYVAPNKARAGQREINQNRTFGTWASVVSVLASIAILIFK